MSHGRQIVEAPWEYKRFRLLALLMINGCFFTQACPIQTKTYVAGYTAFLNEILRAVW